MGKQLSVIESIQIEWVPVDSLQKKKRETNGTIRRVPFVSRFF